MPRRYGPAPKFAQTPGVLGGSSIAQGGTGAALSSVFGDGGGDCSCGFTLEESFDSGTGEWTFTVLDINGDPIQGVTVTVSPYGA